MSRNLKLGILLSVTLIAVVAAFLISPIAQDPGYHNFADQRRILGIPHFWNVVSNLPLVVVGLFGMRSLAMSSMSGVPQLRTGYFIIFLGITLTGLGSSYYHWNPSNTTLVWDRLAIIASFMAFFSVILGESISMSVGRWILWPLVFTGIAAVEYWNITEMHGNGDLAPYAVAQFLPMLLIPLILILFRSHLSRNAYIWAVLVTYAVAKIAEQLDEVIFLWLGMVSGHTLKHILAALCGYFLLLALHRKPGSDPIIC